MCLAMDATFVCACSISVPRSMPWVSLRLSLRRRLGTVGGVRSLRNVPESSTARYRLWGDEDTNKLAEAGGSSKLAPEIQELVKMIFDVETMKKALLEFEVKVVTPYATLTLG